MSAGTSGVTGRYRTGADQPGSTGRGPAGRLRRSRHRRAPAYHLLSPAARGAYLGLAAGGRRTDVPAGLVLLFCFGLERRVLLDADARSGRTRRAAGDHRRGAPTARPVRRRRPDPAQRPRAACSICWNYWRRRGAPGRRTVRPGASRPPPVRTRPRRCAVRAGPGPIRRVRTPVPADLARLWVRHHPSLAPRSAQADCPTEFDRVVRAAIPRSARRRSGAAGRRAGHPHPLPAGQPWPEPPPWCAGRTCPTCWRSRAAPARSAAWSTASPPPSTRTAGGWPDSQQGRGSLAATALLPASCSTRTTAGSARCGSGRKRNSTAGPGGRRRRRLREFWSTAAPERMARDEAAALHRVLALLGPRGRAGRPLRRAGPGARDRRCCSASAARPAASGKCGRAGPVTAADGGSPGQIRRRGGHRPMRRRAGGGVRTGRTARRTRTVLATRRRPGRGAAPARRRRPPSHRAAGLAARHAGGHRPTAPAGRHG